MGMTEFLLVLAVGGGIIAVLFATFKGAAHDAGAREAATSGGADLSARQAELEERQLAVSRSLEEIEVDRADGNLSEEDYESLRQRYEGEAGLLAKQIRELAEGSGEEEETAPVEPATAERTGFRIPALVGWAAATVAFVALAWLVMSTALRPRSEGQGITGSLPGDDAGAAPSIAEVDRDRLAALEERVAEAPDDIEALNQLGHMYLQLQRYPQLAEVTRRALELDPGDPEALTHLGMLLFSTEHPQGVMSAFDQALASNPDFAEALQFKGMIAFMSQDYSTAVEAWEHYVDVVPAEEVSPRINAMLEMARQNAGVGGSESE